MTCIRATAAIGERCVGWLIGCAYVASADASGAPGAEGVALALLLLPVALYLIAVAVLLLFAVFRGRRWVIANVIGSVLAAALVVGALSLFTLPPGSGSSLFVFGTLIVVAFGAFAPGLQYCAARKHWRAVSVTIRLVAALALGAPLATWFVHELDSAKYTQAREKITARGRTARAGDLAAVIREHAGVGLHTGVISDYLRGLQYSPLLLDAARLNDDDRAAAELLIADRSTYFGPLHAKLVWDRHAAEGIDALLADPDAPYVRYHLLDMLERHAASRYCANADAIRALQSGVHGWFAAGAGHAPEDARENARIDALCASADPG